jgi:hypothetical protein
MKHPERRTEHKISLGVTDNFSLRGSILDFFPIYLSGRYRDQPSSEMLQDYTQSVEKIQRRSAQNKNEK